MPEFSHADVTQHYEIEGSGPSMVLIAGMASDSASWGPLVPLLAPEFTVIRPDNRLTGRTRPLDVEVTVPLYAADVAALLRHLNLGPAHIIGHSMGGMIALQLANDAPDLVRSLTLLASAPLRSARNQHVLETMVSLRETNEDLWLQSFYPWLFAPVFFDDPLNVPTAMAAAKSYAHAQDHAAMKAQVAALKGFDPAPLAAHVTCPAQAILGAQDLLYPLAETRRALGAIPGISVHEIAEAAHSVHWDAPEPTARLIKTFAKEH